MIELPSRYDPGAVEDKWYGLWESKKYFCAKPDLKKKPFTIVIPPPNVTGILHMGHALNNTIQDILIRYHRMKGEESLWMPGTDHAGIATQNVVEKSLAKEGLKRQDLGREKFISRVWEWREQYGSTIIRQLKKIGASCDWERLRFTMDEDYSKSVVDVFVKLYEKGLIYRGSYIINWCPRCQTALSDEEAPHHDLQGNLYFLKYPLKSNPDEFIIVATTRPETMLGDTAVAVNPKDKRYKGLVGKTLILPLVNREIKIIADSSVDMKFGTGAVKVTPAHDPNDYALGKKHKLEFINVMYPDGKMNGLAGDYKDMDRFEARGVILEDLKEKGLLEKIEPHALSAGHCYRCHTIIEPYLSKQWFVKMKPLAKPAIEAVKKGKIKFHPERWTKVYLNWMENIQDWCISRQIWWGHRLPVYYCKGCDGVIVSKTPVQTCPKCKKGEVYQDEDVLDTWFSSWLWPFATFKNKEDLKYFYPTSVLVTAPEIIFFWVARMIMSGFEFMKEKPFSDVYIHGTVRDIEGKKMSKSLGNVIDPLEIIKEYGTDALRFSLISITAQGQDVFLSKERFEQGRNFANKIWNASRFILMNLDADKVKVDLCVYFKKENLSPVNRWILSRFYSTLKEVNKNLDSFRFNEAANLLYSFFWHEFCDWYLELIKSEIKNEENQVVMYKILEKFLRTAHPFMPFITEEIWQKLAPEGDSIMIQPWPHIQEEIIDKKAESGMNAVFEIINAIRNMRAELEVPLTNIIDVKLYSSSKAKRELFKSMSRYIKNLAKVNEPVIGEHYTHTKGEFVAVLNEAHAVIPLAGVVDIDKYKAKVGLKIENARAQIKSKESTLANPNFAKRAPLEIVEGEKEKLKNLKEALKKLEGVLDGIR
ncbi:MAG: valine--tRNA ligase [Candidatus Omnitrophica bacterium]|nr:valine--tRNA ligase [Candidatus Omnitrophota bacterium]